jgi:hypothetical protein
MRGYIILAALAALVFWFVAIYNRLVRGRNLVQEGWSGIDVQLKRRSDLIPNLIETVKGYMGHERGVLEKVTELRSQSMRATRPACRLPPRSGCSASHCWPPATGLPAWKRCLSSGGAATWSVTTR